MKITITPEGADCQAHSFISSTGLLNLLITLDKPFYLSTCESSGLQSNQPTAFVFADDREDEADIRVEFLPETQEEKDGLDLTWFLNICKGQFHFLYPRDADLLTEKQAKWRAERDA